MGLLKQAIKTKSFSVTTPNQPERILSCQLVDVVVDSYGVVTCADPQKRSSRPMYPQLLSDASGTISPKKDISVTSFGPVVKALLSMI